MLFFAALSWLRLGCDEDCGLKYPGTNGFLKADADGGGGSRQRRAYMGARGPEYVHSNPISREEQEQLVPSRTADVCCVCLSFPKYLI